MTEAAYTTAARTVGWLMREIESAMERFSPNASVDSAVLRSICSARVPTPDEIAVATNALLDLGILRPAGRTYSFDAQAFIATRDYRRGFQEGLTAAMRRTQPGDVSLCIAFRQAFPRGLGRESRMLLLTCGPALSTSWRRLAIASSLRRRFGTFQPRRTLAVWHAGEWTLE